MNDQEQASERDAFRGGGASGAKTVAAGAESFTGRGLAYLAGLFGAWFFTPVLWWPILSISTFHRALWGPEDIRFYLIYWAVSTFALAPFGIALVRARRQLRLRAMIAVAFGLIVGLALCAVCLSNIYLMGLGLILWVLPTVLGPVFGLIALARRSQRGDAQVKALALLGIAPAILIALLGIGSRMGGSSAPRGVDMMKSVGTKPAPSPAPATREGEGAHP